MNTSLWMLAEAIEEMQKSPWPKVREQAANLSAISDHLHAEISGLRKALEAVWEDWEIANDASGMENYEIKDVAPETVTVVQVTLRVPRMASSIASGALSDGEMKAQALRCACRGYDDYCACQNTPDQTTIQARIAKAESAAAALTVLGKEG